MKLILGKKPGLGCGVMLSLMGFSATVS